MGGDTDRWRRLGAELAKHDPEFFRALLELLRQRKKNGDHG